MFALLLAYVACISHGRRTRRAIDDGSHSLVDIERNKRQQEVSNTKKAFPLLFALRNVAPLPYGSKIAAHKQTGMHSAARVANVAQVRHAAPLLYVSKELSEDTDFNAILDNLAPSTDIPKIRKRLAEIDSLSASAVELQDWKSAARLRDEKRELLLRDPAALQTSLREGCEAAVKEERYRDAARLRDRLRLLRKYLPQFNLAGKWNGVYANHGETIVTIDYDGDTLYATKVTGDSHVPAGEITFRADLSSWKDPSKDNDKEQKVQVEMMMVNKVDGEVVKPEVEDFSAEGLVATKGMGDAHYIPGRLYLLGEETIGFLWESIGQFVVLNKLEELETDDFSIPYEKEKRQEYIDFLEEQMRLGTEEPQ